MKKIVFLAAFFLLFSCSVEPDRLMEGRKTVLHVITEGGENTTYETKTYADENLRVLWNNGDLVSVFMQSTYNSKFKYFGEDGANAGDLEDITPSGIHFSNPLSYIYAVYPYASGNGINNAGTQITLTLPAEQAYKANSFGVGANTMVAVTDGNMLSFKNACGYLSLRLYGEGVSVSSVTIQGNNGEKIAGPAQVSVGLGTLPSVTMGASATESITLTCNPSVTLGSTAADYKDFWFVIPPVTFTNGFKITVTDILGNTFVKTTTNSLTVARNQLDWMNPLEVKTESGESGSISGGDLSLLAQATHYFIEIVNDASEEPYMTVHDSILLWEALRSFSEIRETALNYVYDPSTDSRDRRYFKYCTGYDGKPIIDSIKFTEINYGTDLRSHKYDLTTTRLDNYNEGEVIRCNIFHSLCLQLFNSSIAALFEEANDVWGGHGQSFGLIDPESSINADNYNAFFGRYRYDATLGAIIPLSCNEGILSDNEGNLMADANFKAYCLENFDTNHDGEISDTEAMEVLSIDCSNRQIYSLVGIELFCNLQELECALNTIYNLDLSKNLLLTSLSCGNNRLTSLDLSSNTALKELNCDYNHLRDLDVSACTALTELSCRGNLLTSVNVSHNTALTSLNCDYNQLTSLGVSNNTALASLGCSSNQLTSLNVSHNTALIKLECNENQLTSLNVSANTALTSLVCSFNQLTSLDVSHNTALTSLNCDYNQLTSLGVSNNTALASLGCSSNQLTSLDVSHNTALTSLNCSSNQLTSLDVSHCTALTGLYCWNNQLTGLDVSNNTALIELYCQENQLTSLDVSHNMSLAFFGCVSNPFLTEIWLKTGQTISDFFYDTNVATIKYKD